MFEPFDKDLHQGRILYEIKSIYQDGIILETMVKSDVVLDLAEQIPQFYFVAEQESWQEVNDAVQEYA